MVSIPTWLYMWNPKIICNNMIITNPVCCCHAPLKPNTRISRSLSMYVPQVRYQTNDSWHKKNATKFAVSLKPHSYMAFSY